MIYRFLSLIIHSRSIGYSCLSYFPFYSIMNTILHKMRSCLNKRATPTPYRRFYHERGSSFLFPQRLHYKRAYQGGLWKNHRPRSRRWLHHNSATRRDTVCRPQGLHDKAETGGTLVGLAAWTALHQRWDLGDVPKQNGYGPWSLRSRSGQPVLLWSFSKRLYRGRGGDPRRSACKPPQIWSLQEPGQCPKPF